MDRSQVMEQTKVAARLSTARRVRLFQQYRQYGTHVNALSTATLRFRHLTGVSGLSYGMFSPAQSQFAIGACDKHDFHCAIARHGACPGPVWAGGAAGRVKSGALRGKSGHRLVGSEGTGSLGR